jgi:hypothetical protein
MRDHLLDLVSHTYDLGCIDLIKTIGDTDGTSISGLAEDRSVVVEGQFAGPVADLIGTVGMPNLSKLKILLNLQEYKEGAKISVGRKADGTPETVNFENSTGDFKNSYRLMSESVINNKLQTVKFKGANWNIEFQPSAAAIMRLKMQAQANAEETVFQAKTEGGDLKFMFGDHSTHSGSFVFEPGVSGQLKRAWSWPVSTVISILSLTGDKVMKISDDGAAMITVNSGIATYNYILPAQSK